AAKWSSIRQARRVVTAALEVERTNKVIGSSLEAAPKVFVSNEATLESLKSIQFEDVCITSAIALQDGTGPADAFRLPETDSISVEFHKAPGDKCLRCWKILPDVGTHKHPGTCKRCSDAVDQSSS